MFFLLTLPDPSLELTSSLTLNCDRLFLISILGLGAGCGADPGTVLDIVWVGGGVTEFGIPPNSFTSYGSQHHLGWSCS